MKKIYAFVIAAAMVSVVNGQTLTQSNHAAANGEMYSTKQCDSLNVSPGAAGANVTWNFAALTIHNSVVANYTTMPSSTSSYPAGCLVTAASLNDQSYYISSPTDLRYYGGNFKVQSVVGTFNYSSPAIAASYPMSLNTTSTSSIAGSIAVTSPFPVSGTFTGNSKVLADGTGTLQLPGGVQGMYTNVMRVVTSQTINYSASATGVITKMNYDYYAPGVKAPMLTIANFSFTSSIPGSNSTQTIVTINQNYLQPLVSIAKNTNAVADLLVYPNPASSLVSFSTENKSVTEVHVFDITGKLVEKQNFTDGNLKLDVSGYNKGLYIYSVLNRLGELMKAGKLTVN